MARKETDNLHTMPHKDLPTDLKIFIKHFNDFSEYPDREKIKTVFFLFHPETSPLVSKHYQWTLGIKSGILKNFLKCVLQKCSCRLF